MEQNFSNTLTTSGHLGHHRGTLICWKTAIAGLFVSGLIYMILTALGAGIGGFTAAHIIEKGGSASGLASGAGLWLAASAIIAVFLGAYFAVRYSEVDHKHLGAANAVVIAALFFFFLMHGTGMVLGSLSDVAGNLSGTVTSADADAAAHIAGDAGWLLFVTLTVGLIAAIFGGVEGAIGNTKRSFFKSSVK